MVGVGVVVVVGVEVGVVVVVGVVVGVGVAVGVGVVVGVEVEMTEWMSGIPTGTWYLVAAVLASIGMVCLMLALAAMSARGDLKVRGWENRPIVDDDEWWDRDYPDEVEQAGGVWKDGWRG